MPYATIVRIYPQHGAGQDRAAVFGAAGTLVAVVADGAGGTGAGAEAAETVIAHVRAAFAAGSVDPATLLRTTDQLLAAAPHGGQTTAVVAVVDPDGMVGASAGDSGVWLITEDGVDDLTAGQARKPLLGGGAHPARFAVGRRTGTLLLASDGLLKYATREKIATVVRHADLEVTPDRLVDLVRLKSGGLQDDVAVVLVRLP
jgi:serine/threonine protein phosphatase PrpC